MDPTANAISDQHLPQDILRPELVEVALSTRFIHFVFDVIVAFVCYFIISLSIILLSGDPDAIYVTDLFRDQIDPWLLKWLEKIIPVPVYYFLCEWLYYGRTFGKWLTGSRAVRRDGSPLTIRHAFIRTITRMVPFEKISFLFTSKGFWHDHWSKTIVVKDPT